jgi:hypothetical protein
MCKRQKATSGLSRRVRYCGYGGVASEYFHRIGGAFAE